MVSEKRVFVLGAHPEARRRAVECVIDAPAGMVVEVKPATRSPEQNARLWAMLADISRQVVWHGRKLDSEAWKHVFTAALKKQDVVPNIDGTGFVVLGQSTSKMGKREMSELQELISAFGAERDVMWTEPAPEYAA